VQERLAVSKMAHAWLTGKNSTQKSFDGARLRFLAPELIVAILEERWPRSAVFLLSALAVAFDASYLP
jgi:hypothetical protein